MPNQTDRKQQVRRHAEKLVRAALQDTRIIAIVGPRQSGKTTLARRIADEDGRSFVTLDDEQSRQFAASDPAGFMRGLDSAVIDEIQRAPGLILALKKSVDEDPRPRRFIITGSVDLFKGSISPDSLAGRVETIDLLPFSQSEIEGRPPSEFIARAFQADFPGLENIGQTPDLTNRLIAGGYPEALSRRNATRRRSWLLGYARSLAERDVAEIAEIEKQGEMARLIERAALATGQLLNRTTLGSELGIDAKTVDRWLALLEHMFLVRQVRAWHRNSVKRLIKSPKLQFLDSGLLTALLRVSETDLERDRQQLGPLLECFVYSELVKTIALSDESISVGHYRDKDQVEIDFVLERARGQLVGIEVKSRVTAKPEDFRGLKRLRDVSGESFACGVVLHDGDRIQQVGDRLFAMPASMLWNA